MDTKNKVVEKVELVINALDYAHEHNLDINNKEDIKKNLEVLEPQHTSDLDKSIDKDVPCNWWIVN